MHITRTTNPDHWVAQIFAAQAVAKGGIVRRSVDWVDREIGQDRLKYEVQRRGFHLLRAGGQFIVICQNDPIQIIF